MQASKIALRIAVDYNAAVEWYFGLAAARDIATLGTVLLVLFLMWTVATIFSDSGLCLLGESVRHSFCALGRCDHLCVQTRQLRVRESRLSLLSWAKAEKDREDREESRNP